MKSMQNVAKFKVQIVTLLQLPRSLSDSIQIQLLLLVARAVIAAILR